MKVKKKYEKGRGFSLGKNNIYKDMFFEDFDWEEFKVVYYVDDFLYVI